MPTSYPRLTSSSRHIPLLHPRRLDSIPTPPPPLDPESVPALPTPPRPIDFLPGYTVTTHLVPSAYPRLAYTELRRYAEKHPVLRDEILPLKVMPSSSVERKAWVGETAKSLTEKRYVMKVLREDQGAPNVPQKDEIGGPVLWNAVNRYARVEAPRSRRTIGLTVVANHANGLHKETWEATFKHLIALCERASSGIHIDEIWSMDAANQGDSALVNEGKLSDVFDWADHARDILSFVENYIPAGPFEASSRSIPLPVHLTRVSEDTAKERVSSGFGDRRVVALGHSIGGCCTAYASLTHPKLFESLTLVDPIIIPSSIPYGVNAQLVGSALSRRSVWASRDEARTLLLRSPFFRAWDPAVLELYVQYGLTDIPASEGGGVRLKTPPFQEAVAFAEDWVPREVFDMLEGLDESVKLRWIMAHEPISTGGKEATREAVWRRLVNSSNAIIEGKGHLLVQEAPYELAKETVFSWRIMYAEKMDPMWARLKL